ncbi:MAG: PilW family protein [Burkholderiaceae bacterium]
MMRRQAQAGMTLIEMMIAVVISMILSMAVMLVMSSFEGRRRTLGSTSDLDQAGNLAMFQLDRWIRSAGTGIVQGNSYTYGCKLFASKSGTQLLPVTSASPLPAPFAAVNPGTSGEFRLAPMLILPGQTTPGASGQASDVLVVMSSGNDGAQVPTPFTAPPAAAQLTVYNTTEFSASDLLLIADQQQASPSGPANCLVSQASNTLSTTGVGKTLPLAGTYYAATVGTRSVTNFTKDAVAIDLGGDGTSTATSLPPSFLLLGVGDNNTLFSYDLLKASATPLQAQGEGVFEMHAVYGIDSTGNSSNKIDQWVSGASTSAYSVSALSAGTAAASGLLKNIRAVRVALIMRTALPEKDVVNAATTLTMFPDLSAWSLTLPRTLSVAEQHYRYRVVETTIPVRNNNY